MYNIELKSKGKRLPLNEIPVEKEYRISDSKYISFKDICKMIFKEGDMSIHDDLKVEKIKEDSEDHYFHGQLGLAEYGNERGLYDSKNDIERKPLQPTDKVSEPFFFMFSIPLEKGNDKSF